MFTSASLGIYSKNPSKFYGVLMNQFIFGVFLGLVAMFITYRIPYKFWREYSLPLFIASILLTCLVFIPGLGYSHGGARRWVEIFGFSFQPVEFLKIGFIIYFSAWLSWAKSRVQNIKYSILPLGVLLFFIGFILQKQPDTKSLLLMAGTSIMMLFVSGTSWKKIVLFMAVCLIGAGILVSATPYLRQRVNTFINPNQNQNSSSYQLNQSLIAIGSGGVFGRGLGQSIQKFSYLPEPQGDSIFAVIGEDLGFVGTTSLIILFLIFAFRGLKISYYAPDSFSKIFVFGVVTLTFTQAIMNMASVTGVFPLTGVPLPFISHGGTSLFFTLACMGIILQISKFQKYTN